MPTIPRRPAAQREREQLQTRRLRAAELFGAGVRQAEVARQLGVSAQAVSVWHRRWKAGGPEALRSKGPSGPAPRLSDQQLATVEQALLEGAGASGFVGELWTVARVALVIERLTGVQHHPGPRLGAAGPPAGLDGPAPGTPGWRARPGGDRPVGRARPATEQATAQRRRACLVFFDESALSLTPNVRRTRGATGPAPDLDAPVNWKQASMATARCDGVRGGAQPCFHVTAGNDDTDRLIGVLTELRRFLGGEQATLLWDGRPSHHNTAMRNWIRTQRSWLVVQRLPAYPPEVNPVEGLWSSLKAVALANLAVPTLAEVIEQAHQGVERVRRTPHLASSFLRHAGLSVS